MNLKLFIKKKYILCFLINFNLLCNKKPILIITTAYNTAAFISLQYKCFKKFFKNDFKYVVFNDAIEYKYKKEISNKCMKYHIDCYDVPDKVHHSMYPYWVNAEKAFNVVPQIIAAIRHTESLRYALNKFNYYRDGIVMIIDADCFLTKDLEINSYIKDNAFSAFCNNQNIPNPIISIFNMKKIISPESMILEAGFIGHNFHDSFMMLPYYFNSHPELSLKYLYIQELSDLVNSSSIELLKKGYTKEQSHFINLYKQYFKNNNIVVPKNIVRGFIDKTFLHMGQSRNKNQDIFNFFIKSIKNFIK